MIFLKLFLPAFFIPMILDFIWLGLLAKPLYLKELAGIGRINGGKFEPKIWAAGIVYFLIAFGIITFALPKVADGGIIDAFISGAVFGFILYGVYDFTNLAVLKDYTLKLALADTAWGIVLCGLTAMGTKWISIVVH